MDRTTYEQKQTKCNKTLWTLFIVLAFSVALFFRVFRLGTVPFQNSDDIGTVWATVFYYPRGIASFVLGDESLEPNPALIATLPHGPLQPLIALPWVTALSWFDVKITEFVWHLPFAVIGACQTIAVYLLGRELQSRRAGLIAAIFVSVTPLHIAFSRTSGESHFILSALLQTLIILFALRYLKTRQPRLLLITGVVMGLDMLTDFSFPSILFNLYLVSVLFHLYERRNIRTATRLTFAAWFKPMFILPLLLPTAMHLVNVLVSLPWDEKMGMFGRLLSESLGEHTQVGGIFVSQSLTNLAYVMSSITLILCVLYVVLFFAFKEFSLNTLIPLLWTSVSLFPLTFLFARRRLVGHFIVPTVGILLFTAVMIDKLLGKTRDTIFKKAILVSSVLFIFLSLLLKSQTMIFASQSEHGSVGLDRGTKAAAYWIRKNTPERALVFGDPYVMQQEPVCLYYYHRPILSPNPVLVPDPEQGMKILTDQLELVDVIVVGIENINLLPERVWMDFAVTAYVYVDNVPSLVLYSRNCHNSTTNPEFLNAKVYNALYDQEFARLHTIIDLPIEEIKRFKTQIDHD